MNPRTSWAGLAAALALAACKAPAPAPQLDLADHTGQLQAWVQAVAGPAWQIRALTDEARCPDVHADGQLLPMTERSAPGVEPPPPGNTQPERTPSEFHLRACEAAWPVGAAQVQVGPVTLRAPRTTLRRIVVMGDTGCRLKASENEFQPCNDSTAWPFQRVVARALALQPDLVVHVGDYHYRESPCPPGQDGCAGSPWGYGDDAWQADFFRPARALLAAAPWVFVRGNHEACNRAGQGWLRYLDAQPGPTRSCLLADGSGGSGLNPGNFTEPFAVPLSPRSQLIVFDSSQIGTRTPPKESPAWTRWRAQLDQVAELSRNTTQSLFVAHHPSLAYNPSALGVPTATRSGLTPLLQDASGERLFPAGVQATLHGHIHIHELLGFSTNQPASLVIGNGGSSASGRLQPSLALLSQPLPRVKLETFQSHAEFGFSLLTATPEGWQIQAYNTLGQPLGLCKLAGQKLRC
ncbi:metallophosphoesterase family protein [Roseateles sp. BYS87W]|uniref:Metallophosphoesterase family protein n=1 Tax=Pelomonas baiyunensis TaxID=3299026 RepID=A0ABW7H3M9_9BURK